MPSRPINQKIAVSVVYIAAMFMSIMDVTIVNVALPTLGRDFHVQPDSVSTVAIGYLVSLAVWIPASGWLGDRFGGRSVLLISIAIFTGASALCGISQNLGQLVFFRVVQGVGGGMMVPVGMALLYRTFPPSERVRVSSLVVVPTAMAPALGPVLGGLFVTDVSWRWVFFVNLPIGAAAFAFGLLFLERLPPGAPSRFDLTGFLLSAGGLGSAMYGLSEGPFRGWGDPLIVTTLVVGGVLLVTMVLVELRMTQPLIAIRLFHDRLFRSSTGVITLGSAAFLGMLFLTALFLQDALDLSALQAGLIIFPEALGVMAGAQVVTRLLYPALGPRRIMVAGLLTLAATLCGMSLVTSATSLWWIRVVLFFAGYGMAHVFVPSQAAGFATVSPEDTGRASTMFNALRQLGGAVGVAILSTVVAEVGPTHLRDRHPVADLTAYHAAFLVAAAVSVIATPVALSIRDRDAAGTMVRRANRRRRFGRAGTAAPVAAAGAARR